ncbi:MAG: hypothetical protein ABL963_00810 [Longimicrobiales bacterium]
MLSHVRKVHLGALGVLALAACGDGTGVGGPNNITLNFQVSGSGPAAVGAPGVAGVAGPPMVLVGTNGTLTIEEVRLIVSEVELDREDDDGCVGDDHGSDDIGDSCEKFNAGPRFLDLPLDGQPIEVMTDLVPAGVYDELEFEIEDLEDDEDNVVEAALIAAVRAEVLAAVPDWPHKASALIVGSFTPTGGSAVDFRVFIDAEIEVEMDLVPNLVIDGTTASRGVTVDIRPDLWFAGAGGTVLDLSAVGQLLELEVEFEDGFTELEIED